MTPAIYSATDNLIEAVRQHLANLGANSVHNEWDADLWFRWEKDEVEYRVYLSFGGKVDADFNDIDPVLNALFHAIAALLPEWKNQYNADAVEFAR